MALPRVDKVVKGNLVFHQHGGEDFTLTTDTKANILASTPTAGTMAFSTDTFEFYIANGTGWMKQDFALVPESANPDMGYVQTSSKIGYRPTYLTNKVIENSSVGYSNFVGTPPTGAIRITSTGYFQIYLNGVWNNVVINFVFRENSSYGYTFEHQPIGFTQYIEIMSGNSLANVGLNGLPITQNYLTSMGPYPSAPRVGGYLYT